MGLLEKFNNAARQKLDRLNVAYQWMKYGPPEPKHPLIYGVYSPTEEKPLPEGWEYFQHKFADIPVGCVRIPSRHKDGINARITFFTGLKSTPDNYNTPTIRALQRMGMEIDIIPLPDPRHQIGYAQDYKAIVKEALTDNPLPHRLGNDEIAHIIYVHSSGATALADNARDKEFLKKLRENYAGIMAFGAHFSSPFRKNFFLRITYGFYSCYNHDKPFGQARLDFLFDWNKAVREKLQSARNFAINHSRLIRKPKPETPYTITPKDHKLSSAIISPDNTTTMHGQVHYSILYGEGLMKNLQKEYASPPEKEYQLPTYFVGGEKDFVSCKESMEKVAKLFGAVICLFDAEHQPLLQSRKAVRFVRESMDKMIDRRNEIIARSNLDTAPVAENPLRIG